MYTSSHSSIDNPETLTCSCVEQVLESPAVEELKQAIHWYYEHK